ncbi:MAG: tRNA pseudouridine(38-40) synthase TruA [Bacteroidota bacterium]
MKRYFFEITYRGTDYFGWQRQPKQVSIQQELEENLSKLFSNQPIEIVGCGRTDTGVHAQQYFFHADLPENSADFQLVYKLNKMLSDAIVVRYIKEVNNDMHARFSAKRRTYRYFIHAQKDPFLYDRSWYYPQKLDLDKMNHAAKCMLGTRDFTSFSKLHTDVKTNICSVHKVEWKQLHDDHYYFEITADRFLRNMVRATVGTLLEVGLGKLDDTGFEKILDAKDRGAAAVSVPAHGLFLWEIEY